MGIWGQEKISWSSMVAETIRMNCVLKKVVLVTNVTIKSYRLEEGDEGM